MAACFLAASCVPPGDELYVDPAHRQMIGASSTAASEPAHWQKTPGVTPTVPPDGPIELTVEEAILLALEHNQAFKVQRLAPAIAAASEARELAAFDPRLRGSLAGGQGRGIQGWGLGIGEERETSSAEAGLGASRLLPTGTELGLNVSFGSERADGADLDTARAELTVAQALLRGAGKRANLATLRQARLDTLASRYELRGEALALVAQVESTYWDTVLAQRKIEIFQESLKLAKQQLEETAERIEVGRVAETEIAAAQAEVALRSEGLINARSTFAKTRLWLLRLIGPPGGDTWDLEVVLRDEPTAPEVPPDDVKVHVTLALSLRPELNQARLALLRGDLEIVKTRNGLLPKMDLFVRLGKSGYADSFKGSLRDLDGVSYDLFAGLTFEYPIRNRRARAEHERALVWREQAEEALRNLEQLVQVDVRSAHIEVARAKEQSAATAATRRFREEAMRAETEKLRVGKSASILVAQAQRDLVASRISEVEAVVNLLKALVDLHRADGTLLERKGISAPGLEPVGLPSSWR